MANRTRRPYMARSPQAIATILISALTLTWTLRQVWDVVGPTPWAAAVAKTSAEGCYQESMAGEIAQCVFIRTNLEEANRSLGPVRSYRVEKVRRGVQNDWYTVRVEAKRARGNSLEEIVFVTGRDHKTDDHPIATAMEFRIVR